jgi:hypothetical protein
MHHSDQRGVLLGYGDRENDPASRNGSCETQPVPESRTKIPEGNAEAGKAGGFPPSVVKNLRYPFTSSERQAHTMMLQELLQADEILSRHFGPKHKVRQVLAPYVKNLRDRLG